MKLYELQQTFDEMTTQLKELDNCVSPDKNSEQYKMLWDDRAKIKGRISRLEKSGRVEECAVTSCKGNDECLEHCPCDCHKKTSDEVWDEALTPLIEKLPDMNKTYPHYYNRILWDKVDEIIKSLNKLNRP